MAANYIPLFRQDRETNYFGAGEKPGGYYRRVDQGILSNLGLAAKIGVLHLGAGGVSWVTWRRGSRACQIPGKIGISRGREAFP